MYTRSNWTYLMYRIHYCKITYGCVRVSTINAFDAFNLITQGNNAQVEQTKYIKHTFLRFIQTGTYMINFFATTNTSETVALFESLLD